jgi:hypothetical protein
LNNFNEALELLGVNDFSSYPDIQAFVQSFEDFLDYVEEYLNKTFDFETSARRKRQSSSVCQDLADRLDST